ITLVQGVAKGDHMDLTLQKGTELGVSAFRPALTKRGLHLPAERLSSKSAHWQGVIVGACEQCGRTELPALHAPATLAQCLQETAGDELRLVLDPTAEHSLAALAARPVSITLVVGPEGGLAPEEIAEARHAGCTPVRLGPRILRTETACIAALTLAQARWGDLM
ncbi:MAG: RsmE family RNA methyltransferase, partial [Ectothiorhodospiraceae bacterium]|nr:RsmE family RNA methyltransferase [Ectothiorhodospiraceae bacterium]